MHDEQVPAFSCQIPVRWGDLDGYQHVNNTLYFRYFEEARFQFMQAQQMSLHGDSHPVVVTIGCTFLRPVFYPDTLTIELYLSEPGRSSFMMKYRLYSQSDRTVPVAEGYSKVVWVSTANGKSVELPPDVRRWFEPE